MQIRAAATSLMQLFFPQTCMGCGFDNVSKDQLLCLNCLQRLPVTEFYDLPGNAAETMLTGRLRFNCAASHLFFTRGSMIQHLMHQFKYRARREIGEFFGRRMGEALQLSPRFGTIHALIPMPLHPAREKKRTYNQATVICEGIASVLEIPVLKNAVRRTSTTGSQTSRNRIDRWENIRKSFVIDHQEAIAGKHVLLVDDVITTGATIEACGSQLLKAPGLQLSICTLACAMK